MAGSHQHPLLQSSEQEYGSPVAVLKFAAEAASGRLGRRLLELHIGDDGACSILPVSSSNSRRCRCRRRRCRRLPFTPPLSFRCSWRSPQPCTAAACCPTSTAVAHSQTRWGKAL